MAGLVGIWAVTMFAVGAVMTVLIRYGRADRRRIAELEAQVEAMSEAERIVARAQHYGRRNRDHLKLLVLVPVLWLADRFRSPQARLLAATAVSGMTAASFVAVDGGGHRAPIDPSPPAAADTAPAPDDEGFDTYSYSPADTTTTSSVAALPPAPATDPPGSTLPDAPVEASTPAPTTTTLPLLDSITTTTLPVELPPVTLPRQCHNPKVPLPICAGG